jgi:ABC-type multidrug transport system ATPase subunit
MLVGRARCFFMDDVSTGLDSSTTFEIVTFLWQMAHLMDFTMVISLLQPAPETFELFDDIILLCEGQTVYHGPRQNVIGFFNTIGFTCSSRKNAADFLQEVISHFS